MFINVHLSGLIVTKHLLNTEINKISQILTCCLTLSNNKPNSQFIYNLLPYFPTIL